MYLKERGKFKGREEQGEESVRSVTRTEECAAYGDDNCATRNFMAVSSAGFGILNLLFYFACITINSFKFNMMILLTLIITILKYKTII